MTDLPEPITPADCDLRDYPWMPLDVRRLLTSETWVLGSAEEKVFALTLWCESWCQVPAASLSSDERMLAHISGAGAAWKRVREHVLRGWVKCNDGRLYHPVVAEKAREAWDRKLAARARTEAARLARLARRVAGTCDPPPSVTDTEPSVTEPKPSVTDRVTPLRRAVTETDTEHVTQSVTSVVTSSTRTEQNVPEQERKKERAPPLRSAPTASPRVALPPWLPLDAWNGFVAMRKSSRKPMTDRAAGLLIAKLDDFRRRGLSVEDALNQSTMSCWAGVFEPRNQQGNRDGWAEIERRGKLRQAAADPSDWSSLTLLGDDNARH